MFGTKHRRHWRAQIHRKKADVRYFLCILLSSWVDVPFHSKTWLSCMSMRCRKLPSIRCQLLMYFLCCLSHFAHFMWFSSLNIFEILSSLFLLWISDFSHSFEALEFEICFDGRKKNWKKLFQFEKWRKKFHKLVSNLMQSKSSCQNSSEGKRIVIHISQCKLSWTGSSSEWMKCQKTRKTNIRGS